MQRGKDMASRLKSTELVKQMEVKLETMLQRLPELGANTEVAKEIRDLMGDLQRWAHLDEDNDPVGSADSQQEGGSESADPQSARQSGGGLRTSLSWPQRSSRGREEPAAWEELRKATGQPGAAAVKPGGHEGRGGARGCAAGAGGTPAAGTPLVADGGPPAQTPKPTGLPRGWRAARDADGGWYYYHKVRRQPQWERPEC